MNRPTTATPAEEESLFGKICKGAMLMEKAFRLVSSLKPGTTNPRTQDRSNLQR